MPEQPDPKAEERDRFLLGCAVIQSGFVDQDEDAPGWFDILQWHPCFEEANCRARDNTGPCACSGVPFISDEVWAKVGPVIEQIRAEAYERGLREATEGWDREWALKGGGWVGLQPFTDEAKYRAHAAANPEVTAVSRLVGPWEPAAQPEPAPPPERLSPETIASTLAVVDAPYRPDTPVEYLDDEPEPSRGGTVATEPDTHTEDGAP